MRMCNRLRGLCAVSCATLSLRWLNAIAVTSVNCIAHFVVRSTNLHQLEKRCERILCNMQTCSPGRFHPVIGAMRHTALEKL